MIRRLAAIVACIAAIPLAAQVPAKSYAQELVDRTVAAHPELRVVVMHVTPPKASENVIVASNIGRLGKLADADDLRVIATGEVHVEQGHGRIEAELPLRDVSGATVGALGLSWSEASLEKAAAAQRAEAIRDELARRILNAANLMDAYPFDPRATTKTRAQRLVDRMVAAHPEVTVLAMRGRLQGSGELVLLGSTFGRHGKKADEDDLKVLRATEPATGVYSAGKRFGVDLALRDRAGTAIGTMNVGYAHRPGAESDLVARALALRDEIEAAIATAGPLDDLDP